MTQKRQRPVRPSLLLESSASAESKPWYKRLWPVVSILLTLAGVPAFLLSYLPRVSISTPTPPHNSNLFSSLVTVTNTGYLPLHAVRLGIAPLDMGGLTGDPHGGTIFESNRMHSHDLGVDERFDENLDDLFFVPMGGKDWQTFHLELVASYQMPVLHFWHRKKAFQFYVLRLTDGTIEWKTSEAVL